MQQEQEFRLGVQLVHPNIAATYSMEQVSGVGRCIVQEWIDGFTLGEWLQTRPDKSARQRVFGQLLDALEYLHGLQLVHHDLKPDNILITRNGTNLKLIDFGLSALDATLLPKPNDVRADIQALGRLMPSLLPGQPLLARKCRNARFDNIAALRRAIARRKRLLSLSPMLVSLVLLIAATMYFYLSWHERNSGQQRYEAMLSLVNTHAAHERDLMLEMLSHYDTFDTANPDDMKAYKACIDEYTAIRWQQWAVRDSIIETYDENDPFREQLFHLWTHKETEIDNEIYPIITSRLKNRL